MPISGIAMKLNELDHLSSSFKKTEKMPVLFLGHGSPMNAIEENEFVSGFRKLGQKLPKPNAILCISAHWETKGTFVTAMQNPKTIHDFGGFPEALYQVSYPAPGSPLLAEETQKLITKTHVQFDHQWGLDHGCWSVVKHLYPNADIPIIQMSLDYNQSPQYHYDLASQLSSLRTKGILIIGSGNMVHNLGLVAWNKLNEPNYGFEWAIEANEKMKKFILEDNHRALIQYKDQGKEFALAIPTAEHYLPLLYTIGLKESSDKVSLFNDKLLGGSLTMTSVVIEN